MRKQRISLWSMATSILLALPVVASSGKGHIGTAFDVATDQCFAVSVSAEGTLVETIDLGDGEVVAATRILLADGEEITQIDVDPATGVLLVQVANGWDTRVAELDPTSGVLRSTDQKGANQACNYQAIYYLDSAIAKIVAWRNRVLISATDAQVLIDILNTARQQARVCSLTAAIATLNSFNTTVNSWVPTILTPMMAFDLVTLSNKAIGKLMSCSCTYPATATDPSPERSSR